MKKSALPAIQMKAKPSGLTFKAPKSAIDKWDRTICAAAAPPTEGSIEIMGEIGDEMWGGISAGMIRTALKAIGKGPVRITLNSPGGDAFEGVAIYNVLREHPGNVTVNVIGLAASAASVIAMAGDRIEIGEAAFLMIHSAWGVVMGNRDDMREFADVLDKLDNAVAGLYASRSGQTLDAVLEMMKKETWMTGPDAVKLGFADISVADDKKKKASAAIDHTIFASTLPANLLNASPGDRQRYGVRLSASHLANAGPKPNPKGKNMKTVAEQIVSFEAKRAADDARMTALMDAASEKGETLGEAETQEYDSLQAEVTAIDGHLVRLRAQESRIKANATAVDANAGNNPGDASLSRGGMRANSGIVSVRSNIEPGIKMARFALALARANNSLSDALNIVQSNQRWMDTSPELKNVMMAAVAAGDTTTAGWASELVYNQNLAAEFIEYLRPMTILGRLPGFRRVPFNVRMGSQTSGSSANWVGQAKPIPMSKLATGSTSLGITKMAGLLALDDELLRSSSPSVETLVRDDLANCIATFVDTSMFDPNQGGTANVQPASLTYNVTPTTPSGTNAAAIATDVKAVFSSAISANLDVTKGYWVTTATTALALSAMLTSLGSPQYPGISITGGVFFGLPVVVSQNVYISGSPDYANMIVFIIPSEVLLADDGQITIEMSREASLEMLDNPTNAGAGATVATTAVSLFQTHSAAIKAVRYINWTKRRTQALAFIRTAAYA